MSAEELRAGNPCLDNNDCDFEQMFICIIPVTWVKLAVNLIQAFLLALNAYEKFHQDLAMFLFKLDTLIKWPDKNLYLKQRKQLTLLLPEPKCLGFATSIEQGQYDQALYCCQLGDKFQILNLTSPK